MKEYHKDEEKIISYTKLRAFIGIIGIILPFVAVLGCLVWCDGIFSFQVSISHYYYSKMHIVFTGVLCVLGGFLITYKGRDEWENKLSNFAGACAFGIAACPTTIGEFLPDPNAQNLYLVLCNPVTSCWGKIHFVFAGLLFACFVVFCFHFFQKKDDEHQKSTDIKFKRRRRIYTSCGWAIIISILFIALFAIFPDIKPDLKIFKYSTFIFETTSLWAFGIAWLVKGSQSLKNMPVVKNIIKPIR